MITLESTPLAEHLNAHTSGILAYVSFFNTDQTDATTSVSLKGITHSHIECKGVLSTGVERMLVASRVGVDLT